MVCLLQAKMPVAAAAEGGDLRGASAEEPALRRQSTGSGVYRRDQVSAREMRF